MFSPSPCYRPLDKRRRTLIENTTVTITSKGPVKDCSILISENGLIEKIGTRSEILRSSGEIEQVVDATKCLAMPGFINNHSHIAMTLLRGLAEDLPILNWLRDKIWPLEATLKPWQIEIGAAIGVAECLLSGTTTVNSNYFFSPSGSEASAAYNLGMRGFFSHGVFDWTAEQGLKLTEDFVASWHGKDSGRIRIETGAHSPYSCSPELLKRLEDLRSKLNEKYGSEYRVLSTIHVAEATTEADEIQQKYKVSAHAGIAAYLRSIGILNKDTIAAHAIHLLDDDFRAFKESGASIASCPVSNLKVGMGVADLPRDLSEGITVSLGTDGPASNNTLDMFETTKFASLLQKGLRGDTTALGSRVAFDIATAGGARSLQMDNLGSLQEGMKADIVLVDLSTISATPFHDPYNHVVFSARAGDVRDVFVDGRWLVRNRSLASLDHEKLNQAVDAAVSELRSSAPKLVP
jgi:5-methylthioadenosine/S-adenosylhomocysteine deaminase